MSERESLTVNQFVVEAGMRGVVLSGEMVRYYIRKGKIEAVKNDLKASSYLIPSSELSKIDQLV